MSTGHNRWWIPVIAILFLALIAGGWAEAADELNQPIPEPAVAPVQEANPENGYPERRERAPAMAMGTVAESSPCQSCSSGVMCGPRPWPMSACPSSEGCPPACCLLPEFPPPRLYARLRGMALKRDGDEHVLFARLGEPIPGATLTNVLSNNSVELPFEGGGEVLVGWMVVPSYNVEFTYFELNSWDEQAAVRDSTANSEGGHGNMFSPFGDFGLFPINQLDYNDFASLRYRSWMNNFELNLRHVLPMPPSRLRASWLFGGRVMRIDDDLAYLTTSDIPALTGTENAIDTVTRNRLLGAQIGGLFEWHVEPAWWVNFEMVGAICQNKIDLDTSYTATSGAGGSTTYVNHREDSNTSFVGELELSFVYERNRHLSAEVGYRAMWITGLAVGVENFQTNADLLTLGPPALNDSGVLVYHGPHAGVTLRW
ncbi:MAG: BBP7 family outer membrane beta-barrel protein [Planctomycetia bacterium]|nr:BBP7 family outer membrane beta-barrel protein [Planctomycetia bacterium]